MVGSKPGKRYAYRAVVLACTLTLCPDRLMVVGIESGWEQSSSYHYDWRFQGREAEERSRFNYCSCAYPFFGVSAAFLS